MGNRIGEMGKRCLWRSAAGGVFYTNYYTIFERAMKGQSLDIKWDFKKIIFYFTICFAII